MGSDKLYIHGQWNSGNNDDYIWTDLEEVICLMQAFSNVFFVQLCDWHRMTEFQLTQRQTAPDWNSAMTKHDVDAISPIHLLWRRANVDVFTVAVAGAAAAAAAAGVDGLRGRRRRR